MAVMGFGMLGVLGLQSSLRGNADVSKQRSEAVRIAQETIETARAFSVLGVTGGAAAYDSVVSTGPTNITRDNGNATFSLQTTVTNLPAAGNEAVVAPHKQLVATVSWVDRNGETQMVRLATMISATAPETAAALSAPADASPIQQPSGRNPVIPQRTTGRGFGRVLDLQQHHGLYHPGLHQQHLHRLPGKINLRIRELRDRPDATDVGGR